MAGDCGGVRAHGTFVEGSVKEPERSTEGLGAQRKRTEYAGRNGLFLRKADAAVEVGFADSTRSAEKPRTRGSGEADED